MHEVRSIVHDTLASAAAPASDVDGLIPRALTKFSWSGRLSLLEFITLLRGSPHLVDHIELMGSLRVQIKFVEADRETYNAKLLTDFIGGWLFSAAGSDSQAAGKRRLHDPPGTHGYVALVPMHGRRPHERMRYDVDSGTYTFHAAATRINAAGSYIGGGTFPLPASLGSAGDGAQWVYSLVDEKHVAVPTVHAGELPRAPQDTPLALQAKVATMCKPTLSRFLYGAGRIWTDRTTRLFTEDDTIPGTWQSGGGIGGGGETQSEDEPESEPDEDDPTVGASATRGARFRARDRFGRWYTARVEAVRGGGAAPLELHMHFMGWHSKWDEWVQVGAGRLRAL